MLYNDCAAIFGEGKVVFERTRSGILILLILVAILPQALKAAITVEFGEVISGSIDPAGEVDDYVFSAIANDTILVRMSRISGSLWPAVILYSPNGTELEKDYGSDMVEVNCTLAETGEYTVNASDHFGYYTGNYSIFFQRLNNPRNTISTKFGETASGSINPPGDVDTYVFSVEVGDAVLVRASRVSGSFWPELRLYLPNGTELVGNYGSDVVEVKSTSAEAGNYTIVVNDYFGDYNGNYSLFVQRINNPGKATYVKFGEVASGSIDPAGDVDTYSFSAAVGDTVLVRVSCVSGSLRSEVRFYSPNGTELVSDTSYDVVEINYTIAEAGNYTVLTHDYFGDYIGNYSIFVQRLNNPGNAVSIVFGETALASIDPAGDVDTYVFSAEAGDTVLVRASRVSGFLYPEVRLYARDGTELGSDWDWGVAELTSTLLEDGNYAVLVCDYFGGYTGNYTLHLSEVVFEELTLGNPYVGNVSMGEWHSFYVSVEANKNLLVTLESTSLNGILELYGRYSQAPTRSDYDYLANRRNAFGNYDLPISPTENGTYYFSVYGKDVEGLLNYTITALIVERHVSNIYPRILTSSTRATVYISGIGFTDGIRVELRDGNAANITAHTVVFSSSKVLIAHFDLSNASLGIYDVAITWPDNQEKIIQAAVEVKVLQEGTLYSLPDLQMAKGAAFTFDIGVPEISNLFVTLQKTMLVSYGNSWSGELSLMYEGIEVVSTSGSHDLILHIVNPNPGVYSVKVAAHQAGSGILNVWASLPELPLGEWVVGTIYTSYGSIWYQVEVPPEQGSLCFEAEAMGAWSHFDIYYEEYGSSDHWVSRQGTQTSIEIPNPAAGTYVVEFMDSAMLYSGNQWSEDQTRGILIRADTEFNIEPPPGYLPVIISISTNRGGNTGLVTIEIRGGRLDPNATVSLTRPDRESIIAQYVYGDLGRTALTAVFDLIDKEPGEWNLVVTNLDGQNITAPTPFIIEAGGEPRLSVDIIGRSQMRVGRSQRYIVTIENSGVIDAYDYVLIVELPEGLNLKIDLPNNSDESIPLAGHQEGRQVIPIWCLKLNSESKLSIPLIIEAPETTFASGEVFGLSATLIKAPESRYSEQGQIEDVSSSPTFQAIKDAMMQTPQFSTIDPDQLTRDLNNAVQGFMRDCIVDLLPNIVLLAGSVIVIALVPWLTVLGLSAAITTLAIASSIYGVVTLMRSYWELLRNILGIELVSSTTPEDKYGSTGFDQPETANGERKRFVPSNQEFYYKIDFWNKENATAPACDVFVKDQLDTDLDWSTFRFEEIGFLNWTVELEPCHYFNVYVDTRPQMNLIVNVEGTFDPDTGEASWTFRSLDPATMATPDDPMAGFLPPITESGYEVGWVGLSVNPKVDLPTGTRIENQAFVNFDGVGPFNPAPKEGPFVNTIDSAVPNSWVKPLLETQNSSSFVLEWEGEDGDGSGIRDYTIYVSEDRENFVLLLKHVTETSTVFNGTHAHTYYFLACARDNVGNAESISYESEAATTVILAPQFTISNLAIYPKEVQIGENVTISVLVSNNGSAEGTYQLVLKVNGTIETTMNITLAAGASQNVTFIVSRDAPGAYVVEVDGLTGEFTVEAVPTSSLPPWWIIGILITLIILASITLYLIKTRRKRS